MEMNQVPIDELREAFLYNPTIGTVVWRNRGGRGGSRHFALQPAGSVNGGGYLKTRHKGMTLLNHRIAFALFHGRWPEGEIDHIDRNPLNNRIENLREASHSENKRNSDKYKNSASGIRGVSWQKEKGKWVAQISAKGKSRYLGTFENIIHAALVRRVAEHQYWGGIHKFEEEEA